MLKNAKEDNRKHRIMFVDDEIDILDVVARGLESFGFEVHAFSNPLKALSLFRLRYYDAIILDIRMPQMSGFELARKIWQIDSNSTICFFSAFEGYENEALKIFFNRDLCFVKKPASIGELARHITSHLSSEAALSH